MNALEVSLGNVTDRWQDQLIAPSNRYIVVKIGDRLVTFPDVLVSEIMILERSAILALPFYENAIVGVVHHQATLMPLLLLRLLMGEQRALITESLTVVRLSKITEDLNYKHLAGIGLIVDRVIGSLTTEEHQYIDLHTSESLESSGLIGNNSKKINQTVANIQETEYTPIEIILSRSPTHLWQPLRWLNDSGKHSVG
jgi:chemotaxis signal transduction protein